MKTFGSSDTGDRDSVFGSAAPLSKRWHPVVVQTLRTDAGLGSTDIEPRLGDVSPKLLSDALEELQAADVIDRDAVSTGAPRVEYSLTEQGREFAAIVESIEQATLARIVPEVVDEY